MGNSEGTTRWTRRRQLLSAMMVATGALLLLQGAGGVASAQGASGKVTIDLTASEDGQCPGVGGLTTEIGKTVSYCLEVANGTENDVSRVTGIELTDAMFDQTAADVAFGKASGGGIRPGESVVVKLAAGRAAEKMSAQRASVSAMVSGVTLSDTATVAVNRPVVFTAGMVVVTPNNSDVKSGAYVQFDHVVTNPTGGPLSEVRVNNGICAGPLDVANGDANNNEIFDAGETWSYRCIAQVNAAGDVSTSFSGIDKAGANVVSSTRTNMVVDGVTVNGPSGQTAPSASTSAAAPTTPASVLGETTIPTVDGNQLPLTGATTAPLVGLALVLIAGGVMLSGATHMAGSRND